MMNGFDLRVVIYRQGRWWLAQCLEVDIAAMGENLSALEKELRRLLLGYQLLAEEKGAEVFAGMKPAPSRFFEMWEQAAFKAEPTQPQAALPSGLDLQLPRYEHRIAC